jgi:hypothetical protein
MDDINIIKCRLERQKLVILRYLAENQIEATVDFDPFVSFDTDKLCQRIVAIVYGEEVKEEIVRYPADWWQAVKERWLPAWAKRRWPIRYKKSQLRLMCMYPGFCPARDPHYFTMFKCDSPPSSA